MKTIIITPPTFFHSEAETINAMFYEGLDLLHIRKPNSTDEDIVDLIKGINPQFYNKIVLHDNFQISKEYNIGGLHINSRNKSIPLWFKGRISSSCHTIEEVKRIKQNREYVFLSPIFNSISKQGYKSTFKISDLEKAQKEDIIDNKVFALGGIELSNLPIIKQLGFGGAAFLGDIWGKFEENNTNKLISHFAQIIEFVKS